MLRKVLSVFAIHHVASKETWEKYRELKIQLKELHDLIEKEFWATPEAKLIKAGNQGVTTPKVTFENKGGLPSITIEHYADLTEAKPIGQTIDPSVLNQLINSKLLTPEEKRSLLEEQGILKRKEVPETPEA